MNTEQDYFSSAKWEPPPPRPRSKAPLIVLVIVLALGLLGFAGWLFTTGTLKLAQQTKDELTLSIKPAKVPLGEPWDWRLLSSVEKDVSLKRPRPEIVFDDFNADGKDDIYVIDFKGESQLFQPDGKSTPVKGKWDVVARFYSWDFDRDGVAELVPHAMVAAMLPTSGGGWARVRLPGG